MRLANESGQSLGLAVVAFLVAGPVAAQYPHGRLPDTVTPKRYTLALEIDPSQERFSGSARIEIAIERPTERIWLHGRNLAVANAAVESRGKVIPARFGEVDTRTGVARLDVDEILAQGEAVISIRYTAPFTTGAEGLYRLQSGNNWYAFTQLQAIDARRVFPSFDEPRFKTPFELTVLARAGDEVMSNAWPQAVERQGDRMLHRFGATLPLPTYLIALAVGPLDIVDASDIAPSAFRKEPLPLRGAATRGKGAQLARALRETPELVHRLEEYFASGYPYPKLDLIASPGMRGAMENAGAIIFSDTLLLLAPDASVEQQRSLGIVNTHEIAHQWFGNLVTPAWWDDIWLNEAFAVWLAGKVAHAWRPDFGFEATSTVGPLAS